MIKHDFTRIEFTQPFQSIPIFLGAMQSSDGMDTSNVRWQNKNAFSIKIQIDEEQSKNTETRHTTEVVGYMAMEYTPD